MKRDTAPSTAFVLTMRYQSTVATLDDIVKDYLPHLSIERAKKLASTQELPFPVFRADKKSQKSTYLVRLEHVATWLDSSSEDGYDEWRKVNH